MSTLDSVNINEKEHVTTKRVQSKIVEDEYKIEVPEGWRRQVVQRQGGLSAGKFDVYYFSPIGKKLRSKKEVQTHCEEHNFDVNLDLFRFTRVSLISNQRGEKRKSDSAIAFNKTPKLAKRKSLIKSETKRKKSPVIKNETTKLSKKTKSLIISSEGLTKKKMKKASWVPPKSPFNLFQENLFQNPWQLLIGSILYKLSENADIPGQKLFSQFIQLWPTPEETMKEDWTEIAKLIRPISNSDKIAKMIVKFCEDYVTKDWTYPKELHGIGKYGNDSYRIFCVNEWKKVKPSDHLLTFYIEWLWDNYKILGLD
ncbi:Methyl-CpG-binding domain protein 4 [Armadillidium nasatum]|uniref:Methyl-CpG-binding domain protein 4 n=1 Tax=Armadillidium nasatum TaxID=96803 RepID=A0A5N5T9N9_9CRUS|nr:Methyl-CpG-binding domain protein 4 [Armadillidium nasatum]